MAMGIALRRRSIPIKWYSFSFNPIVRIQKIIEVIKTYRDFKRENNEFPLFLWLMAIFGAGVVVIPISCLVAFLATR